MSTSPPYPEYFMSRAQREMVLNFPWLFPTGQNTEWVSGGLPGRLGVLPYAGLLTITGTAGGTIASAASGKVAIIHRISIAYPDGVSALDFDVYAGTGAAGGTAYMLMPVVDDIKDVAAYFNVQKISGQNCDSAAVYNSLQTSAAADKYFKGDYYLDPPLVLRASAGLQNKIQLGTFTSSTSATSNIGTFTVGDAEDVSFAAVGWECSEVGWDSWVNQENWYTKMFRKRGTMLYANEAVGVLTTTDDNIVDPGTGDAYFIDGFRMVATDATTPMQASITYATAPTDFTGYDVDNEQEWLALADRAWAFKDGGDTYWGVEVNWPPVLVNGDGGAYSDLSATAADNIIGVVEDGALTDEAWITFKGWKVKTADLLEDL